MEKTSLPVGGVGTHSVLTGHTGLTGALDAYLDEECFRTHQTGSLIAGDVTYSIQIFAVVETEATNEQIFAPTEIPASETLSYIQKHAVFYKNEKKCMDALILGMSICKYPDTADRTIVFGTLTKR